MAYTDPNEILENLSNIFGDNPKPKSECETELSDDDLLSTLDNLDEYIGNLSIDYSKTVYIICERKNFRSESFYTAMEKEYKTAILFASVDSLTYFDNPLCFIVELSSTHTAIPVKTLKTIQKNAVRENVPIFLFGEYGDLHNADQIFNAPDVYIKKFLRPYDLNDSIAEITSILMTKPHLNKKKHLMIVDDSVTFLKMVQKALDNDKYRVTPVTSALNCIKMLAGLTEPPDMIIIDYMMPTCNGETLCRMLREDPFVKDLPMVFYSCNENVKEIIPLMPIIDGYMLKNMPMGNVENYIDDVFKAKERMKNATKQISI